MGLPLLRPTFAAAAFVAALSLGASARADSGQEAERLFREAVRLRDAGDFVAACPKFEASFGLDPAPGTLVNLGDCEVRIGKLVAAVGHYKLAAAAFPKTDRRRDLVTQKASDLEPKLAHLTIKLAPGLPATASITRGGAPFDRKEAGVSALVDPGKLAIVVTQPERKDAVYDVSLAEGESKELVVDVGAPVDKQVVSTVTVVEKPVTTGVSPIRTAGFVIGGVGLVGVGLGAVTGILAMGKASTVKEHCDTTTYACDAEGADAARAGEVLAPLSTVAFIAGGVLLAGGVVMIIAGGKKKEAPVAFVPSFGPNGASAFLTGSF